MQTYKRILTELEEAELAQWLKDMNLGRNGRDNDQIDAKVHEILQSRLFTNARGGRKCIKLSDAAQKVAKGQPLSPKWFTKFFARHQQLLEPKVQQQVNSAMPNGRLSPLPALRRPEEGQVPQSRMQSQGGILRSNISSARCLVSSLVREAIPGSHQLAQTPTTTPTMRSVGCVTHDSHDTQTPA